MMKSQLEKIAVHYKTFGEENDFKFSTTLLIGDDEPIDSYYVTVGDIIPLEEFNQKIEFIHKCGKRLSEINKKLAKENEGWNRIIELLI